MPTKKSQTSAYFSPAFMPNPNVGLFSAPAHAGMSSIQEIGDYMQVIVPAYAFGMAMSEEGYTGAKQFAESFVGMQLAVWGLKSVIPETRPDGSDKHSFPSGHTASAVSGAAFIHRRYGIKRAIIPYMMAGFTGFSRIEAEKHYFHDVLAGAAISGLFTYFLVSKYDGIQVSGGPDHVRLGFKTTF